MELGRWLWNLTAVIGGLVDVSGTSATPRDNEVEKCEQIRPQFSNLKIESDAEDPPTWVKYSAEHEQKQLSFLVVYWHHGISLGDLLSPPDPHQFLDYTAITFFRNQAFDANRQIPSPAPVPRSHRLYLFPEPGVRRQPADGHPQRVRRAGDAAGAFQLHSRRLASYLLWLPHVVSVLVAQPCFLSRETSKYYQRKFLRMGKSNCVSKLAGWA